MLPSSDATPSEDRTSDRLDYPFALVLRFRVLQVVCGISALVMGAVGYIEEKGEMRLGLGMPAGVVTVAAAALSIHTSRGFSGYTNPTCAPPLSYLRFLGPSMSTGIPLSFLWLCSMIFHFALIVICMTTLICSTEKKVISGILLCIGIINMAGIFIVMKIDCKYDPDGPELHIGAPVLPAISFIGCRSTASSAERHSRVAWTV